MCADHVDADSDCLNTKALWERRLKRLFSLLCCIITLGNQRQVVWSKKDLRIWAAKGCEHHLTAIKRLAKLPSGMDKVMMSVNSTSTMADSPVNDVTGWFLIHSPIVGRTLRVAHPRLRLEAPEAADA